MSNFSKYMTKVLTDHQYVLRDSHGYEERPQDGNVYDGYDDRPRVDTRNLNAPPSPSPPKRSLTSSDLQQKTWGDGSNSNNVRFAPSSSSSSVDAIARYQYHRHSEGTEQVTKIQLIKERSLKCLEVVENQARRAEKLQETVDIYIARIQFLEEENKRWALHSAKRREQRKTAAIEKAARKLVVRNVAICRKAFRALYVGVIIGRTKDQCLERYHQVSIGFHDKYRKKVVFHAFAQVAKQARFRCRVVGLGMKERERRDKERATALCFQWWSAAVANIRTLHRLKKKIETKRMRRVLWALRDVISVVSTTRCLGMEKARKRSLIRTLKVHMRLWQQVTKKEHQNQVKIYWMQYKKILNKWKRFAAVHCTMRKSTCSSIIRLKQRRNLRASLASWKKQSHLQKCQKLKALQRWKHSAVARVFSSWTTFHRELLGQKGKVAKWRYTRDYLGLRKKVLFEWRLATAKRHLWRKIKTLSLAWKHVPRIDPLLSVCFHQWSLVSQIRSQVRAKAEEKTMHALRQNFDLWRDVVRLGLVSPRELLPPEVFVRPFVIPSDVASPASTRSQLSLSSKTKNSPFGKKARAVRFTRDNDDDEVSSRISEHLGCYACNADSESDHTATPRPKKSKVKKTSMTASPAISRVQRTPTPTKLMRTIGRTWERSEVNKTSTTANATGTKKVRAPSPAMTRIKSRY